MNTDPIKSEPSQAIPPPAGFSLRRVSLAKWIVISVFVGIGVGWLAPDTAKNLDVVSHIFLNLIKCIIVPLIFSTLVVGIAGHSDDLKAVGRLAIRSLIYFEVVTTFALAVGLIAVNLMQPGLSLIHISE